MKQSITINLRKILKILRRLQKKDQYVNWLACNFCPARMNKWKLWNIGIYQVQSTINKWPKPAVLAYWTFLISNFDSKFTYFGLNLERSNIWTRCNNIGFCQTSVNYISVIFWYQQTFWYPLKRKTNMFFTFLSNIH